MTGEQTLTFPQNLTLEDRRRLTVTGVTDIGGYDEQTVVALTQLGELTVKGEELHIIKMSVDAGELEIEGEISSLMYSEIQSQKQGLFSRLFK